MAQIFKKSESGKVIDTKLVIVNAHSFDMLISQDAVLFEV